jgi:3-deoxy-D-manno-octulosonic-acid transferase/heptosyltransferase-1
MDILIVKLSAIGDVIQTLPALNAIRKHYPHARITWLVEEEAAGLITGHSALDRVIVSRRKRWAKGILGRRSLKTIKESYRFVRELKDTRYDLIIDFHGLLKSGLLIGLSKGKRKVGFGKGMEHAECSYLFLNELVPAVDMDAHAVTKNMMLIRALGIPADEIEYRLPVSEQDRRLAADLLVRCGDEGSKPLVAINPVARWATKLWSHAKFAELADRLVAEHDALIVFTGSQSDREVIARIGSLMRCKATNLAGETTLKFLAALYEKTEVAIVTDTGPMHLAAAVGTPVVALFGPTAPWRTGPFGSGHQVIRIDLECSPCFKRRCPSLEFMEKISVDQVLDRILSLGIL